MSITLPLNRPFPEYVWRWASADPTESLNQPAVYFGCLKVLVDNEGKNASSEEVNKQLEIIEKDLPFELKKHTNRPVNLVRSTVRNIFRNSGQYWRMSGLLTSTTPIRTSDVAKAYVANKINKFDYASYLIKTLTLPNPYIIEDQEVIDTWKANGLEIKPLEELFKIFLELSSYDENSCFISDRELLTVIIPMIGNKYLTKDIAKALIEFRNKKILGVNWYSSKEARWAKEFLIFLKNYEIVDEIKKGVFFADESSLNIMSTLLGTPLPVTSTSPKVTPTLSQTFFQKRERKTVSVLSRPQQQKFRKELLTVQPTCILSGVKSPNVLQACHIIPVKNHGSDDINNGIILRSDLHILYDIGDIKIMEDGSIKLSDQLAADPYYSKNLPKKISIPSHVNIDHIRIRNKYDM